MYFNWNDTEVYNLVIKIYIYITYFILKFISLYLVFHIFSSL